MVCLQVEWMRLMCYESRPRTSKQHCFNVTDAGDVSREKVRSQATLDKRERGDTRRRLALVFTLYTREHSHYGSAASA